MGESSKQLRSEVKAIVEKTMESIKTSIDQHGTDIRAEALKEIDARLHVRIKELDPSYDPGAPVPTQLPT